MILVDKQEEIADSLLGLCVRCFLHGIAFSLLFFVLVFFGVFLTFFLVTIGSWLGARENHDENLLGPSGFLREIYA